MIECKYCGSRMELVGFENGYNVYECPTLDCDLFEKQWKKKKGKKRNDFLVTTKI